ncbi:MAG TPA: pyridoxamine 5'-phosphate oxidase family protein [Acidimicrobiales bacterium]|nr:pyridoxamine 5'-phosphate oxidase family protein [Acidimicrobiales bacterium]
MVGADPIGLEPLDERACRGLLGDRGIGRVAVSIGAVPAVFPVNYGVLDGDVVFRTTDGTKFDAAVRRAVVAFEVDEVDPLYHEGWSVLVVGRAEVVTDEDRLARAGRLPMAPWAPGPHEHLVAIRPAMVSGRRIVQGRPA